MTTVNEKRRRLVAESAKAVLPTQGLRTDGQLPPVDNHKIVFRANKTQSRTGGTAIS
jgi:hypothetical protein